MSFDLKIKNGDISLNNDGSMTTVVGNGKLRQDILKILLTDLGSNKYHKRYGSYIGKLNIGDVADARIISLDLEKSARNAIKNLMALQRAQSRRQDLSPGEIIIDINDVTVERDELDPRLYNISVSVMTREITDLATSLSIRIA
jgi:phage baseplate assembly protein W